MLYITTRHFFYSLLALGRFTKLCCCRIHSRKRRPGPEEFGYLTDYNGHESSIQAYEIPNHQENRYWHHDPEI